MTKPDDFLKRKIPRLFDHRQSHSTPASGSRRYCKELEAFKLKLQTSNTTVLAIKCKRSAVVATDRRLTADFDLISDEDIKIYQITDFSGIALSGSMSVIQDMVETMKVICNGWESNFFSAMSPDGQAKVLNDLVAHNWDMALAYNYFSLALPVLAAYDQELRKPRVFSYGYDGSLREEKNFAGEGCGFPYIQDFLDTNCKDNLDDGLGIHLAIQAICKSAKYNVSVSPMEVALPTVAVINKKGFRFLKDQEVKKYLETELPK